MTFQGRFEELVSRCIECDLAEPESLASLGGSAPGVVDGVLSYDMRWNTWFNGKIGIWPIGKWEPVKRSLKKCAKGMAVWKNQCITQDVYCEYLIQKFLPAVKEKWPMRNGRIRLQQDGAKSHILEDDVEFKEVVDEIGLNLTMFTQLPNSPDTNILDLGFFRAIQSFNDDCPANEEELIKSVENAYGEYPYCKLNRVWLTLQSCLNKIIENDGGNNYKIPHMGKESLERRGSFQRFWTSLLQPLHG